MATIKDIVVLNPLTMVTNTGLTETDIEFMQEGFTKATEKYDSLMASKEHRIKMTREIEKWCHYFIKKASEADEPLSEEFLHNFTFQIGAHSGYFFRMAKRMNGGMGYALHPNNVFYPIQSAYDLSRSKEIPEKYDI
jgi:hypothetical protein